MNPSPKLHGQFIPPYTNNNVALENAAIIFWQSFMTKNGKRADPPQLTNIRQLAKDVRSGTTQATADDYRRDAAAYPDITAFTGIAHAAITPSGSFKSTVDRSPVAAESKAGWWVRADEGGGFTVVDSGDAKEKPAWPHTLEAFRAATLKHTT